jgi:hypothetical protein
MREKRRRDDHTGEERFLTDPGSSTTVNPDDEAEKAPRRARGLGTNVPDDEKNDSGFFGAGDNDDMGDDNLARETEPGYQADKWDRGTIVPR